MRDVAIAGSGIVRSPDASPSPIGAEFLVRDACLDALREAGLAPSDVDGIFQTRFGPESPDAVTMQRQLGVPDLAAYDDIENVGPAALAAVSSAANAIRAGACEVALVFRSISKQSGHHGGASGVSTMKPPVGRGPSRSSFLVPYGDPTSENILISIALRKQRRLSEGHTSPDDYGVIAVNARRWAQLNDDAVFREPLTLEEYHRSRFIVDPLRLLDCDYPITAASAIVLTSVERAEAGGEPHAIIDAVSFGTGRNADWTFADDFLYGGTVACSDRLWARSTLSPTDMEFAQIYDGFSHFPLSWIESLGFCERGDFHDWVDSGDRIGPGGQLPLNTSGGQLAEGRLHGMGHIIEGFRQLTGTAGRRQIPSAQSGVIANAFGPQCGAMVLRANE